MRGRTCVTVRLRVVFLNDHAALDNNVGFKSARIIIMKTSKQHDCEKRNCSIPATQ